MFVDRDAELAFLNRVLARQQHPGPGQLVMLYGPKVARAEISAK
jgi:hypothetical protein